MLPTREHILAMALGDMFTPAEFLAHLRSRRETASMPSYITSSLAPADFFGAVVQLLTRHGLVDREFFDSLVAVRTARSEDIAELTRQVLTVEEPTAFDADGHEPPLLFDNSPLPTQIVLAVGDSAGHEHSVTFDGAVTRRLFIGRTPRCDIFLSDIKLSAQHAMLIMDHLRNWYVQDLQSRNRTFVNGAPVQAVQVHAGDIIKVGDSRIVVVCVGSGAGGT